MTVSIRVCCALLALAGVSSSALAAAETDSCAAAVLPPDQRPDEETIRRFERVQPSLHSIFLETVGASGIEEGMSGHG